MKRRQESREQRKDMKVYIDEERTGKEGTEEGREGRKEERKRRK
jgi:hypothetical protein